jgi:VCBS repeat-containing protein
MAGQDKKIDNAPQAKDDVAAARENVALTIDVMGNDLGGNGKSLYSLNQGNPTVAAASGVTRAGAQVNMTDGKVVYVANSATANALGAGQTLTDTFTYTIQMGKNGTLSVATVTVTLTGTNDGPVAVADVASAGENQRILIDVLANDTDIDAGAVKSLVSVTAPKGSAAVVDGKVAFDPGAAFERLALGQTERVTLTYVMKDEHGATSTSTVLVTVTGTNDGPVAVADLAAAGENQAVMIDVLANDTDIDAGAVKTLVSVTAPKGSAAVVDGKVAFDPGAAFDGLAQGQTEQVTLIYIMQDEHGATSTSTVLVTVTGTNDGPVAVADLAVAGENRVVMIDVLVNDTDIDAGAVKSLVSVTAPKGSAAVVGGKVAFDPGAAFEGLAQGQTEQVTLTYVMQDEHGASSTSTVLVTVTGTNDSPVAVADLATAGENQAVMIDVLANDTDIDAGAVKSLVSVTAPKGSAAVVDGKVAFDPGAAFDGLAQGEAEQVTLTYVMRDEHGATSTSTVLVTVTGTNDGPVAVVDLATASENQAVMVDVLANDTDIDAGAVKTLLSVTAPKGSAAVVDGKVAFDPGAAFDGLAQGKTEQVTLTYVMEDEHGATSTSTVLVTVTGTNDAPVAAPDAGATAENQSLILDVLANDTDVDGASRSLVAVQASKGTASVADGRVVFDPGQAFDSLAAGQSEQVTLTYTIQDEGGLTATAHAVVTVTGTNDAPIARADAGTTGENQALTIDVLANDSDVDAGSVKSLVSAQSPKGVVTIQDGKLVFAPGAAFDGLAQGQTEQVTLTYVMRDEQGATATSNVLLTVTGANDGPVIVQAATTATGAVSERADGAADENTAVLTATGVVAFADVDLADTHSATVTAAGADYIGTVTLGVVDQTSNKVGWTFQAPDSALDGLAAGEVRTQTYTVSVSDGRGGVVSQTLTVKLTGAADAAAARPVEETGFGREPDVIAFAGSTYRLLSGVRDANGDGVLDSATVAPVRTILSGFDARGADVGDLDGDGDIDAAVANYSGRSAVLFNAGDTNGDGQPDFTTFYLPSTANAVNNWQDVEIADVDGDGRLDIVEGGRLYDRIHLNRGDVNGDGMADFTTRVLPTLSNGYTYGIDVADLDGDGRQDIVLTSYGATAGQTTLGVLLNLGDTNGDAVPDFRTVTLSTIDTSLAGIDVGDMNGDGRADIAVASYAGGSYVLQGRGDVNGDGAPDFVQSPTLTSSAYMEAGLVDIDGDGDLDVLYGDRNGGTALAINRGDTDGDGAMNFKVVALAHGGGGVAVSDFDRDGDGDVLFSNGWVATNRGDLNGDGVVDFSYAQVVTLNGAWDLVPGDFLA